MELQAQTALCNMNVVDGTKVGSAQMETPAHWLRFQANLRLCVSPLCVSLSVSLFVMSTGPLMLLVVVFPLTGL